jgi:hypothetical protein
MAVSRYDDSDRLQFLIDRPGLTLIYAKTEFRWDEVDLETRGMVSRWRDSARDALDDAIEHRQAVQSGVRAP